MHIITMLFVPVLFLLSGVLCASLVVDSVPTYEHTNRITGQVLTCDMCPPGTHMTAHCTATTPTQCAPCRRDHYTELWNYLPRCLYCSTFCTENQEVVKECSAVSERVCQCKEGFYWNDDFCARHSECGPGHGVQKKGTSQTNTVCEKCPDGFFSNSSSALEPCVKHQECAAVAGCTCKQTELLPGSVYHDTVCGSCEDLAKGGETLRTFLSGFFSMHRMRVTKMKKFVTRYIHKSVPKQRGPLMDEIRDWLAQAPEEELWKVPEMLKASTLSSMAEKLEKRFNEIQEQSTNCSFNV
ncbi:tumor necrosis factor receptor superfamily member 11B-like isoform X2 [Anabas testudineus]|uniref:TNFR-Cys domain-containing protein n=1 Tax=Anabas testudineus TaxID=64144 RepID=A0A3Q1JU65_ANATE|nr:tumor necrosis factor receptor superfamily member 11B-like isoform X1 [Anabas testudineus]XP_026225911.1 tumor necrosis factor receptor superfamily member 11B-like isoform X2 [Anabas testudineus]